MAKKLTRDDYIAFAADYNDIRRFPDYKTLEKYLGISKAAITRRANTYNKMCKTDTELTLLKDRDAVHNEHIEKLYHWPQVNYNKIGGKGKYVVTAAQFGATVNMETLASLKHYCKANNAQLIVMVIQYGIIHKMNRKLNRFELTSQISAHLTEDPDITIVYPDVEILVLNDNLSLNTMRLRPTLNDHLSGLGPTGDSVTQIFAAPVMRMDPIAVSNDDIPKIHMTTGAVTYPRYRDDKAGRRAIDSHCFGGLIVEVTDETYFHYRQLLANKEGEFYDIDLKKYTPKGVEKAPGCVNSVIPGDWHTGSTDPSVREVLTKKGGVFAKLKPLYVVMHDFFDGESISHHDERDAILMAQKAMSGNLSLKEDLEECVTEIRHLLASSPKTKFVFARSNHDEFLDRWLQDPHRAVNDHLNAYMYHILSALKIEEQDKKQSAISCYMRNALAERELKRIHFLTRDEDFVQPPVKKLGIKLDMHGDKGVSGSRGNIAQFNRLAMRTITGHTHAPGIFGSAWRVGTSSLLDLGYNDGPSNWMHTFGIVFENGQRMLVNIIDGAWHG